jgi:uncharacterized membrane protein
MVCNQGRGAYCHELPVSGKTGRSRDSNTVLTGSRHAPRLSGRLPEAIYGVKGPLMSETSPAPMPPAPHAPPDDAMGGASDLRSLAIVCYVLFLLAWMNGITAIVGVAVAYMKRRDAAGTVWQSHFANLILVFWVMVAGAILGMLTWPVALGAMLAQGWPFFWPPVFALPLLFGGLIFPILALWYLYRVIRGLIRAVDERPY